MLSPIGSNKFCHPSHIVIDRFPFPNLDPDETFVFKDFELFGFCPPGYSRKSRIVIWSA